MLNGIVASPGIGIGRAVIIQQTLPPIHSYNVHDFAKEKARFLAAIQMVVKDLQQAQELVRQNIGSEEASILSAHIEMLCDPELERKVFQCMEEQNINVESAFNTICNQYIALFHEIKEDVWAAKSADFQDIRDRMLRILMGIQEINFSNIPPGSILVAEDIPPSQTGNISPHIVGLLTQKGTCFSHISIIARALQLPAIVGVQNLFETVQNGDLLILDSEQGCIVINPTPEQMDHFLRQRTSLYHDKQTLQQYRRQTTFTADGKRILLYATCAYAQQLSEVTKNHADGIGLFRTEFLFAHRCTPPCEEEQYRTYCRILDETNDKPVVFRTLDVGGDKVLPYLQHISESNSFLGCRGIRFCLCHLDIFKMQLAALLRAAAGRNLQISIPMVTEQSELQTVKQLIAQVGAELAAQGEPYAHHIRLGVMIETPAAALCAASLAKLCDFFSIGTNDLTQYTLAADRTNPQVAHLYSPFHPAVLQMIDRTVQAAKNAEIPVCICGEAACDPLFLSLLIGAGVNEFSVNTEELLMVRRHIATLHAYSRDVWRDVCALSSASDVQNYLLQQPAPPSR